MAQLRRHERYAMSGAMRWCIATTVPILGRSDRLSSAICALHKFVILTEKQRLGSFHMESVSVHALSHGEHVSGVHTHHSRSAGRIAWRGGLRVYLFSDQVNRNGRWNVCYASRSKNAVRACGAGFRFVRQADVRRAVRSRSCYKFFLFSAAIRCRGAVIPVIRPASGCKQVSPLGFINGNGRAIVSRQSTLTIRFNENR